MAVVLSMASLMGCSILPLRKDERLIRENEMVRLQYTCRLENGDIAATTDVELMSDPDAPFAHFFLPTNTSGPVRMIATKDSGKRNGGDLRGFEQELHIKLADKIIGLAIGQEKLMDIRVPDNHQLQDDNRYIYIKRQRQRPVVQTIKRQDFVRGEGHEPVVGEVLVRRGFKYAKVQSVTDDTVALRIIAVPDQRLETPWGPARVEIHGDLVTTTIEARVGWLVKTGTYLGRIVSVDKDTITVDYINPFGGETLKCSCTPFPFETTKADEKPRAEMKTEE